jgi:hypothetical protein
VILAAANYPWYVARAGGILAYALLTTSVVVGLLLSGRPRLHGWPRFALEDVHRFVGLLVGTFILLHVGALLVDSYLPFSLANLVIPGTAPYRPLSVALGVVAGSCWSRSRRRTTTARRSLTASGGAPTTSTSWSGCSPWSTASPPERTEARPGRSPSTSARRRPSPG